MLKISNLTFAHPGQSESYLFHLEVKPGEIVAVTGESGAGKSTFLDLIAGYLKPHSGDIALNGESLLPLELPAVFSFHLIVKLVRLQVCKR